MKILLFFPLLLLVPINVYYQSDWQESSWKIYCTSLCISYKYPNNHLIACKIIFSGTLLLYVFFCIWSIRCYRSPLYVNKNGMTLISLPTKQMYISNEIMAVFFFQLKYLLESNKNEQKYQSIHFISFHVFLFRLFVARIFTLKIV